MNIVSHGLIEIITFFLKCLFDSNFALIQTVTLQDSSICIVRRHEDPQSAIHITFPPLVTQWPGTELKPSEHACKIFFNYLKLCVVRFFAKKEHILPPKHASRCFSNEFSQHYWQESFDGDSFVSQSRCERLK